MNQSILNNLTERLGPRTIRKVNISWNHIHAIPVCTHISCDVVLILSDDSLWHPDWWGDAPVVDVDTDVEWKQYRVWTKGIKQIVRLHSPKCEIEFTRMNIYDIWAHEIDLYNSGVEVLSPVEPGCSQIVMGNYFPSISEAFKHIDTTNAAPIRISDVRNNNSISVDFVEYGNTDDYVRAILKYS